MLYLTIIFFLKDGCFQNETILKQKSTSIYAILNNVKKKVSEIISKQKY